MITANVFRRVFHVRYGASSGTAFTVDHAGRQYLVTAAHVVEGLKPHDKLEVKRHESWVELDTRIVGVGGSGELEADVAVLALPAQISPSFALPASAEGIVWGQDVYFLGYPFGLHTSHDLNNGYPLAIVKRGLMSGSIVNQGGFETYLIDGHNTSGFSGGPVVFRPRGIANLDFSVLGIVSGYHTEANDVLLDGKPTGLTSPENTGIVVCVSILRAVEMIEAAPIGPRVTA